MSDLDERLQKAVRDNLGGLVGEELQKELEEGRKAKAALEEAEKVSAARLEKMNELNDELRELKGQKQQWSQLEAKEKTLAEEERNLRVKKANLERDAALEFKRLMKDYLMKGD